MGLGLGQQGNFPAPVIHAPVIHAPVIHDALWGSPEFYGIILDSPDSVSGSGFIRVLLRLTRWVGTPGLTPGLTPVHCPGFSGNLVWGADPP